MSYFNQSYNQSMNQSYNQSYSGNDNYDYNTPYNNSNNTPYNNNGGNTMYGGGGGGGGPSSGGSNYVQYPQITNPSTNYKNPNTADKTGGKYAEHKMKRKFSELPRIPKKLETTKIAEFDAAGKLAMFPGRDDSYPEELNVLIHPLTCDLCNTKMNSVRSAKDHYESKTHDKAINAWINKNYTEKGINPPEVKRFYKEGPAGPEAFHCDKCDLKLTSLTHANQHYAGKKHRMVVSGNSKPSGTGFYNNEGKWIRVSNKNPNNNDSRFGIGDQFKYMPNDSAVTTTTGEDNSESTEEVKNVVIKEQDDTKPKPAKIPKLAATTDPKLCCALCNISVTSALQMAMHLEGSKHQKKLKASGVEVTNTGHAATSTSDTVPIGKDALKDNVLNSVIKEEKAESKDLSMYRTPSGQYYCQICNLTITNLNALEQHLKGKRHIRGELESKAVASLAARTATKI